jgi:hypothetical protein
MMKKFAIKFEDGQYNYGSGFAGGFDEATLYASRREAENFAEDLMDVAEIVEVDVTTEQRAKYAPLVTFELLAATIEQATETRKICVPNNDYYARDTDFTTDKIDFVNPHKLIELLRGQA